MKPICFSQLAAITCLAQLIGSAHAAVIVDGSKVQGTPTYTVQGTLLAIDEPASDDTTTTFIYGPAGPDWPDDSNDGFSVLTGAQIAINEWRSGMWEPDGTPDTGDNVSYMFNKPGQSVMWAFDLPDGAVIHNVYATWAHQGNSGANHAYSYNEGSLETFVRPAANSTGDLVLQWTAADTDTYNAFFQRIFAGDITVAGGDGFAVTWTQGDGGYPYVDTVLIDYTVIPEPGAPLLGALGAMLLLRRRR